MKQLAIIIFLITSLYSHTISCADMFNIIADENISDNDTRKNIEEYIKKYECTTDITLKNEKLSNRTYDLLEFAHDYKKNETFDLLLNNGAKPNMQLATSIGFDFAFFFRENGVGIDNKKASPGLLEFIKTPKYKEFKEEKFKLIKRLLDYGQDPKDYGFLKNILMLINDEKDLEKILNRKNK
ncbi:hypothetical protein [Campylobacter concisus]|jgi:hypothetical protein|uniref:hypothetical protein n=1 Tax=Campylobacter concisus TaxID=199 RepID=UPI001F4800CF|nr:hypothetical protein [Campylobacter concisus]